MPLGDQLDDQLVGHELATLHDVAGLAAELGARGDRGPQHIARGQLDERVRVLEQLGLRAFARAGRAEQDQVHRRLAPLSRDRLIRPSY